MHDLSLDGDILQGTLESPSSPYPPARQHLPIGTILVGDARTRLHDLPPASVDCVITSPPYYGLRDYGVPRQLGLEHDVSGWVAELHAVMAGVARVLKPSGVLWLNLGDSYSRHAREGAPIKSLLLGPERLAMALVSDGWILRNKVIWAKTNPMPTSVTDRLSATYEVVYCFVRSRHYFFDLDAIRVPHRSALPGLATPNATLTDTAPPRSAMAGSPFRTHQHPWAAGRVYPPESAVATIQKIRRTQRNTGLAALKVNGLTGHPLGKNPGDVWHLATAGYKDAHFATFPVALVERPLLATCPERVCEACGEPWRRVGAPGRSRHQGSNVSMPDASSRLALVDELREPGESGTHGSLRRVCTCQAASHPGVVLDPFMGAGTVAVAAERHGRDWVGIELNPGYATLAEERIAKERATRRESQQRAKGAISDSLAGTDVLHTAGAEAVCPYDPRAA